MSNSFTIREALEELGEALVYDMRDKVSVDTGSLRDSIKYSIDKDNILIIHMNDYGLGLNNGTRPHMPPVSAIESWASRKGLNDWAVATNIQKYGTIAHPFMDEFLDFDDKYIRILQEGVADDIEEFILEKLSELKK